ncbi:MAG: MBL fold metallo-hydrolase [Oscillospiraceae bacterium]
MARIRIHVLHCGKIGVAPNLPASAQWRWPAKADARRLKNDARIWLPVSAYLVEHPKGLFLVDAGLPRTVSPTGIEDRAAQLRMFGRGWYTLVHSVVEPGQSIGEQLAARGIRPQDLDYVLFSHLDPDHIAGISEVRGAKRLLVAEEEYFWSCRVNLRYTSRRLWMDEPPERFWYRVNHIGPESRSYDLFGDDSVHLVARRRSTRRACSQRSSAMVTGTCCSMPTARPARARGRRVPCPASAKTACAPKRRSTGSAG